MTERSAVRRKMHNSGFSESVQVVRDIENTQQFFRCNDTVASTTRFLFPTAPFPSRHDITVNFVDS